jgi:hypothetical protein
MNRFTLPFCEYASNIFNQRNKQYFKPLPFVFIIRAKIVGRNIAVDIVTRYWLDGFRGRIPVETRFSATVQTGPGAHQRPTQW